MSEDRFPFHPLQPYQQALLDALERNGVMDTRHLFDDARRRMHGKSEIAYLSVIMAARRGKRVALIAYNSQDGIRELLTRMPKGSMVEVSGAALIPHLRDTDE